MVRSLSKAHLGFNFLSKPSLNFVFVSKRSRASPAQTFWVDLISLQHSKISTIFKLIKSGLEWVKKGKHGTKLEKFVSILVKNCPKLEKFCQNGPNLLQVGDSTSL